MSKGTMLTRQKYCVLCKHRYKSKQTGTFCTLMAQPIALAMLTCGLLDPFEEHKKEAMSK